MKDKNHKWMMRLMEDLSQKKQEGEKTRQSLFLCAQIKNKAEVKTEAIQHILNWIQIRLCANSINDIINFGCVSNDVKPM